MSMIKQNHFPNLTAMLFVVLLGSGVEVAEAAKKPHNKGHVHHVYDKHTEHTNRKVIDKHSKLSKKITSVKLINAKDYKATGIASWYGYESGNTTASGSRFKPLALTAAHRSLPLNTKVKVTNLKNKKSIIVTINDRGPYAKGRLIDLSLGSARAIGLKGTGKVEVIALN